MKRRGDDNYPSAAAAANDLMMADFVSQHPCLTLVQIWEFWRQRADEIWRPSLKVDPGAFSAQRHGWKTPKRTPGSALPLVWYGILQSHSTQYRSFRRRGTASVSITGVHCWGISLELADLWNVICRLILGFSCAYSVCDLDIRVKGHWSRHGSIRHL